MTSTVTCRRPLTVRRTNHEDSDRRRRLAYDPLTLARAIAEAAAVRGGRALVVGGWVRDRLRGERVEGPGPRGLRHRRKAICLRCSRRSGAWSRSGAAFPSTRSATSTSRCRDASRRWAAATRASSSRAIRAMPVARRHAGATSPSTQSRGTRSTDEYEDPFDGRADWPPACCGRRSRHVRRRQPARAACAAVRGALRAHGRRTETRARSAPPSRSTICRPSASGASSRSCCCRRAGRHRLRARDASWASCAGCGRKWMRSSAASRSRSGTPKATCGSTR